MGLNETCAVRPEDRARPFSTENNKNGQFQSDALFCPLMPQAEPIRAAKSIHKDWYQIKYLDMPKPYIHHVHSRPLKVSEAVWKRWYQEERSRDMVFFKVCSTAAFYESSMAALTYLDPPDHDVDEMKFLALYQMGKTIPRYMPEYQDHVRTKSDLWDEGLTCFQIAQFDSDHIEMIEVLGSYEYNEGKQI